MTASVSNRTDVDILQAALSEQSRIAISTQCRLYVKNTQALIKYPAAWREQTRQRNRQDGASQTAPPFRHATFLGVV